MLIEILGPGCPKCKKTYEIVKKVVEEEGLDAEVIKVENLETMAQRGVMMSPAIAIDGVVKLSGTVPSESQVRKLLSE